MSETATVLILDRSYQLVEGTESTMADITSVDVARRVGEELEQASPDLLRAMVKTFARR
jgi:hypothetical protein